MAGAVRRILIIEDEPDLVRGLRDALAFEGFDVLSAGTGQAGLQAVAEHAPQLIILDLMLPDMNGYDVCRTLRQRDRYVPILMLTARAQDADKIRGLDAGADDYVTKPFSLGELVARINALFRRMEATKVSDVLQIGTAVADLAKHTVTFNRRTYALSFYEVELLKLLSGRANEPVSRDEILSRIWGLEATSTNRTVDNFIVKLRKKLEENPKEPRHIITVYGFGYKLVP